MSEDIAFPSPISKNEQERVERRRNARKRFIKKITLWMAVVAALVAAVYGAVLWSKRTPKVKPGEAVPELGREHVAVGSDVTIYNSNPPTSGPHYPTPANWGVYSEPLPDEQLVHNLEHGGIWISYRDKDNAELAGQLKAIADDFTLKVILTPRPSNDASIAVAAWGRLMKMESFEEDQIRDFISTFINRGPEQVPY